MGCLVLICLCLSCFLAASLHTSFSLHPLVFWGGLAASSLLPLLLEAPTPKPYPFRTHTPIHARAGKGDCIVLVYQLIQPLFGQSLQAQHGRRKGVWVGSLLQARMGMA